MGLVGEIDEIRLGQGIHQGAMDAQSAYAGIENADGHLGKYLRL